MRFPGLLNWIEKSEADYHSVFYLVSEVLVLSDDTLKHDSLITISFATHIAKLSNADSSHNALLSNWLQSTYLPLIVAMSPKDRVRAFENSRRVVPAHIIRPSVVVGVCDDVDFKQSDDGNYAKHRFDSVVDILSAPFDNKVHYPSSESGRGSDELRLKLGAIPHSSRKMNREGSEREAKKNEQHIIISCGSQ